MTDFLFTALVSGGSVFAARTQCFLQRASGVAALGLALLCSAPAYADADQNLMVNDNGTVRCTASLKDLTRISLRDDKFAAVSKVQAGMPSEDFQVVNEPIRGDIYLSVPDGFKKPTISFFGTTAKGYVYKFLCNVQGEDAVQIFVANADLDQEPKAPSVKLGETMPAQEKSARLVKAMYEQAQVDGFEQDWHSLAPVNVGQLRVQLVGVYRDKTLVGDILKVQNLGDKPVDLTEEQVAPAQALAVSIVQPKLGPKEATTVYVVEASTLGGSSK